MKHFRVLNRTLPRVALLGLCMMLCAALLVACRNDTPAAQDLFGIDVGETTLFPGMGEDALLSAVGGGFSVSESDSCAGIGKDRLYVLPSLRVYVFAPQDGTGTVRSLSLTNDGARLSEGITIGSTEDEVSSALGNPLRAGESLWEYERGGTTLTLKIRDGKITELTVAKK